MNEISTLDNGLTVQTLHRCRLVFGQVPLGGLSKLLHGFSERAILAPDIARQVGASVVVGEPEDIRALRQRDIPITAAPAAPQ